jgi:alcohol dehydrogenase
MSAPTETSSQISPMFDVNPRTRVIFGPGMIERVGECCREYGGSRVLLVTDRGLLATGQVDRCRELIENEGLHVSIFDDVHPNPTTEDVARGLEFARDAEIDLLVGLGGGSSLDCAKGINFLFSNGGKMEDYWGVGKATRPMLPLIAISTTSGTGSEAQSFALIANAETHMKMACGDPKAACRVAILDPELTVSMPASVTAVTGIDALTHAVESYVTRRRNPISAMLSRESWSYLHRAFPRVVHHPGDLQARGEMQLGAYLAGAAIENSMLGAAHSMANPLSAHFGTTHGIAVGVMLPHVIRYNAREVLPLYGELARAADLCEANDPQAAELLAQHVRSLVEQAGVPTELKSCHVDPKLIPQLADEASRQWTAQFNPRPLDPADFEELYRCAMQA